MLDGETTNLLRPNQISDAQEELARLDAMVNAPPHLKSRISDPQELRKRQRNLKSELEKYTPRAYAPNERDAAVREFEALEDTIREGMPSSEEMRRNPPGAVGKNISWQKRSGKAVQRYKHIALRLLAGGDVPENLRHAGDIANIERLRPLTTSNQLVMDGAQIPKRTDFHIGTDPASAVIFSDADIALLNQASPELAGQLALLPAETRGHIKASIKEVLAKAMAATVAIAPVPAPKRRPGDSDYNRMKKKAAKAGIKTFGVKQAELKAAMEAQGVEF